MVDELPAPTCVRDARQARTRAFTASSSGLASKPQPSSKAAPDSNVLDDAGASFRRTLSRDMHEKAARACKQHCKFVPKAILEHKEVDGMLLRDRVLHDMQAKVPGQRLGAKYWSAIIALYTANTTPALGDAILG